MGFKSIRTYGSCLPLQSLQYYSSEPYVIFSIADIIFEHPPAVDVNNVQGTGAQPSGIRVHC